MRACLFLATGLLVTNLALLERTPKRPAAAPTPRVVTQRIANVTADAQRLAWLWQAKHNALRVPACEQYDPLATLDADVDPTPGREHVVGNRRFGVAIYAEDGMLIAHHDPIGCVAPNDGDQSLSLSFDKRLVIFTRRLDSAGEHLDAYLVERRDDELVTQLELDVGGKRRIGSREREVAGRLYFSGDEVLVKHHGRERSSDGSWQEVDEHCTWQLSTRSSSCHRRAGARTPESE